MNLFKQAFDKKNTLEIIRNVLRNIGKPNFDEGTGVQRNAGITNIQFKESDLLEKLELAFTLPTGDYVAKVEYNEFVINKIQKSKVASIYQHFDEKDLTLELSDNELEVRSLIEKFIKVDYKLFDTKSESTYEETVMGITFEGAYCIDRELGWVIFGYISKQMGFIRPSEANMLIKLFMLEDTVRFPDLENVMRLEMMQTFNILKENDHDIDNEVESNDMDNYLYYVEKGDIQGNVYISQNNMFLVARNTKTNVLKVWNTMRICEDWMSDLSDYGDDTFNVVEYLQKFCNSRYSDQYDYPFEFNADGYRKSVDLLLEEFETATNELVYDSEKGYMTSQYKMFNLLAHELSYSNDLMTHEYNIKRDVLVLSTMDINSPEYFIRRITSSFSNNRAEALHYLFTCIGTGFYWNGQTFTDSQNVFKDYTPNKSENDYSPLKKERPFAFGLSSLLFKLPKKLSEPWRNVVFEIAVYLTDWSLKNPEDQESIACKDELAKVFEEYYNEEVFLKVKEASL